VADNRWIFSSVRLACPVIASSILSQQMEYRSAQGFVEGEGFGYVTEGEGEGEGERESVSLGSRGEIEVRIEVIYFLVRASMIVNCLS